MQRLWLLALAALVGWPSAAGALDSVRVIGGPPISGRVTGCTDKQITVEVRGAKREIPVNEIQQVILDDEPTTLRTVRTELASGRYEDALTKLAKMEPGDSARPMVAQDIEFYKALATAKLALGGSGDIAQAGSMMNAFVKANPTSYHALEAAEVIGDLLVANRAYGPAVTFYDKLAATPWPDYRMRASIAKGRAQMAQRNFSEALAAFESALAIEAKGEAAEAQRNNALVGKARCLAEAGKSDEAIKLAEEIIAKTDAEQVEVQALAYNALGAALKKANRPKESLMAYLHVDLLYSAAADAHAEALANLTQLWGALQDPDRAKQALETLRERYPNSPWTPK